MLMYLSKVIISLTSLLIPFVCISQNNIDSLIAISNSKKGIEKVNTLIQFSSDILVENESAALKLAEQAKYEAELIQDRKVIAQAAENIGHIKFAQKDSEAALSAFFQSLRIYDELKDDESRMKTYLHIGKVYLHNNEYKQAGENLQRSIDLAVELENATLASTAFRDLGDVYFAQKIYGKSIENFEGALQIYLSQEKFVEASSVSTKLGLISKKLKNQETAIHYFQTSLNLFRQLDDKPKTAEMLTAIGQSFLERGMFDKALKYASESLETRNELKDSIGIAECFKDIGLAELKLGKKKKAKSNFKKSLNYLKVEEVTSLTSGVYEEIAFAYSEMGEHELAFDTHLEYSESRDVDFNQQKSRALLEMQSQYEAAFKTQEQKLQIELLEIENATTKKISYFLFALVGLVGLLLANLYLSYRRKQKDHDLLQLKNEEILKQKNEIDLQNHQLEASNISLDLLNKKLIDEISERENIERSSFARDRFLATMSHEMRTPLNVILGLTRILMDAKPRQDQKEHLRTLQFSANDLVVFINDVLDFSKIEAGKLNMEDRPFKPREVFTDLRNRFEENADEKGILFNFFQDSKLPETFIGDDVRFTQIMSNLLTNCFNNTDEGYIKVEVLLYELSGNKAVLRILVEGSDGGKNPNPLHKSSLVSIDEKDENDEFHEQNFSLSITKRLIELQNGKLTIDVEENVRTSFTMLLPFKVSMEDMDGGNGTEESQNFNLEGQRILVVEDNKINQLVVSKMLTKEGAEIQTANNGLEALEIFDKQRFDLILMDIQMPVMDGYRATAEIRRHSDEEKRETPIIALTASAFLTEKEKAVLFGMNDHVAKPFSPNELKEKIQSLLAYYKNV